MRPERLFGRHCEARECITRLDAIVKLHNRSIELLWFKPN
jgi:hypothetical protein